jgi:hypothetical protein
MAFMAPERNYLWMAVPHKSRNSTDSGGGVIPYPCTGGFSNVAFNFVDQGGGFYSIHTLNGADSLCLTIANASPSPGDGKTAAGQET